MANENDDRVCGLHGLHNDWILRWRVLSVADQLIEQELREAAGKMTSLADTQSLYPDDYAEYKRRVELAGDAETDAAAEQIVIQYPEVAEEVATRIHTYTFEGEEWDDEDASEAVTTVVDEFDRAMDQVLDVYLTQEYLSDASEKEQQFVKDMLTVARKLKKAGLWDGYIPTWKKLMNPQPD